MQRLRELGWIEGRNVAIEYRWAEGRNERFDEIAAEFVRLQGRCHCHIGDRRNRSRQASDIGHPDRFRGGGRPGRHRPGCEFGAAGRQHHRPIDPATDVAAKRLELLREVVPGLRRLAILANVGGPAVVLEMREVQAAARTLGLEVIPLEVRRGEDIAPALEALKAAPRHFMSFSTRS